MTFQKAVKQTKKLRLALHGPSGSGKTYTALRIAKGLGGKVAVIDTERGSASLYADQFDFDALELEFFSVDNYVKAINEAVDAGYDVLVIDSLSHAWAGTGGVLDAVNNTKGNTFTDGWGKVGTPQQNRLLDAILKAPLHIIATLRTKTAYEVEKDERGKATPKKIGLAPVQREGTEYEFDIVGALSPDNVLSIEKTRMIALAGRNYAKPDETLAKQIAAWLSAGEAPKPKINPDDVPAFRKIIAEEQTKLDAWKQAEPQKVQDDRAAIIECYKAVKGVAMSIDMQATVQAHPAASGMATREILLSAIAIADACDETLQPQPTK